MVSKTSMDTLRTTAMAASQSACALCMLGYRFLLPEGKTCEK